ncbi:hypothetical protein AYO38_03575 [bacterium SCGC AG-212-C10]|nr:hypothetical protein AYO38_03575 [bacterium SCGC AG-212-C10]
MPYGVIPSIRVQDVARSVQFYIGTLGFELQRGPDISDNNSLKFGDAQIMIEASASFYSDAYNSAIRERLGGRGANAFYIEASDLAAMYASVLAKGANVIDPLAVRDWGQSEFTVEDPDGNWLTFWQAS